MKLYCFAGPNGSGKSTLFSKIVNDNKIDAPFINADDISRLPDFVQIEDPDERNLLAAKYAERMRHQMIDKGEDFAFETVLSTPRNLELLKLAKEKGYEIVLFYVYTENPNINVERVAKRVSQGGHDVPKDKIITRYHRAMEIFKDVLDVADTAYVYDNSKQYKLSLAKINGEIYLPIDSVQEKNNFILPYLKKNETYKYIPSSVVQEFSELTSMSSVNKKVEAAPTIKRK